MDRCAECFAILEPAPLSGRYACKEHPKAGYWSEAIPERGHTHKACLNSKKGRAILHYYGGHGLG